MEEVKYYTPEFEDYHIGMVYEYFAQGKWHREEVFGSMTEAEDWGFYKQKRIPYLNVDIIKSLGWSYNPEQWSVNYGKDIPHQVFTRDGYWMTICTPPERFTEPTWIEIQTDNIVIFKAKVLLKSQGDLQRLMDWLKIK